MAAYGFDHELVMYRMEVWEAVVALNGLIQRDRVVLESLRLNTLATIQPNSSRPLRLTDIQKFPWDAAEDDTEDDGEEMIDIDELKRLSQDVSKAINSSKNGDSGFSS